jgi:hypothetical protein
MIYDELLTLDGLQALLRDRRLSRTPIELITLSACQTAEGDDRAPLGMSGTALKARARSALGTLWPVSDEAANLLMTRFYQLLALGQHSKVGALRAAQVELIGKSNLRHPFHWAPFILIGLAVTLRPHALRGARAACRAACCAGVGGGLLLAPPGAGAAVLTDGPPAPCSSGSSPCRKAWARCAEPTCSTVSRDRHRHR